MPSLVEVVARLKTRRRRGDAPVFWLVTDDARLADPTRLLGQLPRGCGVLVRARDPVGRAELVARLRQPARRVGLVLLVAADPVLALRHRTGLHLPEAMARRGAGSAFRLARLRDPRLLLSVAAHGPGALATASRIGADLAFLSPVFQTMSHPGAVHLGELRFTRFARAARTSVIALGGMTHRRAATLWFADGYAGVGILQQRGE